MAICGASAALAVASVLPQTRENERHTLLVVVGVTILSTVAMVLYPIFTQWMAWTPLQSGFFLGATIHDVAQVVGAASLLEPQAGGVALQTATITKLARVVLLMPVVIIIHAVWKESRNQDLPEQRTPIVPGFLVAFLLAVLLHTAGWVPEALAQQAGDLAHLPRDRDCGRGHQDPLSGLAQARLAPPGHARGRDALDCLAGGHAHAHLGHGLRAPARADKTPQDPTDIFEGWRDPERVA